MLKKYNQLIEQFNKGIKTLGGEVFEIGSFNHLGSEVKLFAGEIGRGDISILINAGVHGEEQAGPFTIIEFIKSDLKKYLNEYNFTFIPVVNPLGFDKNRRRGSGNKDLNRYFGKKITFPENEIVLFYLDKRLLKIPNNQFDHHFDLHEDITEDGVYIYESGDGQSDGEIIKMQYNFLKKISTVMKINSKTKIFGMQSADGVIYTGKRRPKILNNDKRNIPGALQANLFHRRLTKRITTLETPGDYPLEQRIKVQLEHINYWLRSSFP